MNMTDSDHKVYDLIVLGASGYTGTLAAEYITTHLPSNLRWAIAGRSESKLAKLTKELKLFNSDRIQPGSSLRCENIWC